VSGSASDQPAGARVAVVLGTGLIGTSVGLALGGAGWTVHLADPDVRALSQAAELGAGSLDEPDADVVDVVVVCAPPDATPAAVAGALERFPRAAVTDVASLKASIVDALAGHVARDRFVGGHPLAGRETSGPGGARSDLFEGRSWVLTPMGVEDAEALAAVRSAVGEIGAFIVEMKPREHDEAVAVVSHVPQVMASLTAARLVDLEATSLALAGQGLRDVTRIAASDPWLWSQIIGGNADAVVEILDEVADDLADLRRALTGEQALRSQSVRDLVTRGNAGRSRIPGKHGAAAQRYAFVAVVIPDEPGGLARLFDVVGTLGVNIEDLALEHSPGQPVGLATLAVQPAAAPGLMDDLSAAGWVVHR